MKKFTLIVALATGIGFASCTAQSNSPKANLKTDIDSLSYAVGLARTQGLEQYLSQMGIDSTMMDEFVRGVKEGAKLLDGKDAAYVQGIQIGQTVSKQWVEGFNQQLFAGDSTKTISRENLLAGFLAGVTKDTKIMTVESATTLSQSLMESVQAKAMEDQYGSNKAAGEKFLAENKSKEGVVTTPSGLQYKVITQGTGALPTDSSTVKVNYTGTLIDGTKFDSSYDRNEPTSFRVDQVIKGWTEGLKLMPVGSKYIFYIPQELAYGARNANRAIKPFSALIFEVELLGIE